MALICKLGERHGISREDLAYCDISIFKELHVGAADQKKLLEQNISLNKQKYEETCKLSLPPLIAHAKDIWAFEWPYTEPNFITHNKVTANTVTCENKNELNGSIVCIPNADPGYDWLFSYPIGGLVTAWGGANSHMAIRAGELNIPAVIGCGETLYKKWAKSNQLYIDCANKVVKIIG